jgi:serine protease Do
MNLVPRQLQGSLTAILLSALLCLALAEVHADGKEQARHLEEAFSNVADSAFPAVVVIHTRRTMPRGVAAPDHPFFHFQLPPQFERFRQRRNSPPPVVEGRGSGFIVDEAGHILTNHHVIDGNDEVVVVLKDGREFVGKIVGSDPKTDLAVIKIEAGEKLPVLAFADSDAVRVGQWAIAIGAPFNFDYTMTVGIVSQKGRAVGINAYENYIQTDASINPGNSGGPLLDLDGKVIGINDFIVSGNNPTPGNVGLGFAIPANMAREVMAQLIQHGEVVRPWIGIAMQPLTAELKRQFKAESGVVVGEVFADNPADRAGIQPGDVIVRLDGNPVSEPKDVQFGILRHRPGDTLKLVILRDGNEREVDIVADRQRADEVSGVNTKPDGEPEGRMEDFGLTLGKEGNHLAIKEILPNSPAHRSGLKPGDIIYAVNRENVSSIQQARAAAAADANRLLLYVSDGQAKRFVVLEREKRR